MKSDQQMRAKIAQIANISQNAEQAQNVNAILLGR